jgi:hypothetical protein
VAASKRIPCRTPTPDTTQRIFGDEWVIEFLLKAFQFTDNFQMISEFPSARSLI